MDKIWVVLRSVGEYSDRSVIPACWFASQEEAQAFVSKATGQSRDAAMRWRKIEDGYVFDVPDEIYKNFIEGLGLVDKGFDPAGYDSDSVSYYVSEVNHGH